MPLSRIVLRLARNPGGEFAGDDHRGYTLIAPLTADGRLDLDAWRAVKDQCVVRRFAPDEDPVDGHLARHGETWVFDYDDDDPDEDEPVYRLGEHHFVIGDYVSVSDHTGHLLTYKVTEVVAL